MSVLLLLLDAVERLTAMFEAENALFGSAAPRAVTRQLVEDEPEKRRLSIIYEQGCMSLKARPVPPGPERERLKQAVQRFNAVTDEHRRKLGALRQITERLVAVIGEAAQGPRKPVQTYTARAVMRPAFRAKPVSMPLAVNQSI